MRILYVVRGLNQSSGTTHAIVPMAEEMARRGHEVWLYAVRKPAGTVEVMPDPALVQTRMFDMSLPMDHPGVSVSFARAIQREIRGFDIVHIQAVRNFVTWWALRCARQAGVPCIVAPQGSYDPWVLGRRSTVNRLWDRWLEIPLLNGAARIQCLSTREVEQVKSAGITAPCAIIPNGVRALERGAEGREPENEDGGQRSEIRRQMGIQEDAMVVLFLGRIHPKKGLDILVRAFARIQQDRHGELSAGLRLLASVARRGPAFVEEAKPADLCLLIAGSDGGSGYRLEIERLIERAGIAGRTRWLGEVKGEAKSHALRAADIFVLPSRSEGLPVAVLEAMAAGLPVVVTEACNLPEVEEWKAGRVVGGRESGGGEQGAESRGRSMEDEMAEAMLRVLGDADLRKQMGGKARKLAEGRFSWRTIATDTEHLYRQL